MVEQLAPELLPMLVGLETPSNAIPITNSLLSEVQRRGVSRDALLTTLQQLGSELPPATAELLRVAHHAQVGIIHTHTGQTGHHGWWTDRGDCSSHLRQRNVTQTILILIPKAVCCCCLLWGVAPALELSGEEAS